MSVAWSRNLKMDAKKYTEMQDLFTRYLAEKKLRKTEERYAILECICSFPGHFDMCLLHQKLEEMNFHVSRATVYNTVDVLVDSGLIVRHQLTAQAEGCNTKERCRSVEDIAFHSGISCALHLWLM